MSTEKQDASVAELVDAIDSKSVASNGVLVQVRPEVPNLTTVPKRDGFFYLFNRLCGFDKSTSKSAKNRKLSNFWGAVSL